MSHSIQSHPPVIKLRISFLMCLKICSLCRQAKNCYKVRSSNNERLYDYHGRYLCSSCRTLLWKNPLPDDPSDPSYSNSEDSEESDDDFGWLSDSEIHDIRGDPEPARKKQKVTSYENDLDPLKGYSVEQWETAIGIVFGGTGWFFPSSKLDRLGRVL
jgi:hypothetical protein